MPTLAEIRRQYPEYDNKSDDELAGALHRKFAPNMPEEEFRTKLGMTPPTPVPQGGSWADPFIGQGIMMGFGDEAKAGVRGAARRLFGSSGKSLSDLYAEELGATRADLGEFQQRHPVLSPALEVGGVVATLPFGGAALRGAGTVARTLTGTTRIAPKVAPTLLRRVAGSTATSTTQGAIYGAGSAESGISDRARGAARGAGYGLVSGVAAPLVVRGAQAGLRAARDYGAAPAARLARDAVATDRGAKARIGNSLAADATVPQSRLTSADEAIAQRHGVPIYNLDRGGEKTRALAQSAGITSPEGRAVLKQSILDRFATQGERTEGALQRIVGGSSAFATRDALEQQARKANRGNYAWAYGAGDRPIWSPELERLTSSGAIRKAMGEAATRGNDRAVAEGFGGFNPGVQVDPSGIISFPRGPKGMPVYPNIQYWDYVQRELRDATSAASRRGENEQAGALRGLHSSLNKELDKLVPAFGNARKGAARFFGAENALEAGEKFMKAGSTLSNAEAQAIVRKMSPAEQQLFAEGAQDTVTARVGKRGDTHDITKLFNNKDIRERLAVSLGPARAREFEAYMHVERLVDKARPTVSGFSDTARLLGERGMAGGVSGGLTGLGVGYGTGDWQTGLATGIAAALLRRGGANVNQKVARRVAEMLVSDDPAILKQGVALVANNDRWMEALRHADLPLAMGATRANEMRQGR